MSELMLRNAEEVVYHIDTQQAIVRIKEGKDWFEIRIPRWVFNEIAVHALSFIGTKHILCGHGDVDHSKTKVRWAK